VKAAHAAYGAKVEFLGVNVTVNQTKERVRRYLERHDPPFRTLYDEQGVAARAYDVPITSYIVIVDAAGRVAYTGSGADQDIDAVLRRVASR
jgi:predicted transcriptional regulator